MPFAVHEHTNGNWLDPNPFLNMGGGSIVCFLVVEYFLATECVDKGCSSFME
jgi:hypothetical protein